MSRLWPASLVLVVALFAARPAHAEHFDASFNAGVSKRFLSGGLNGSTGPLIGLSGDVALMPLLRLGAYVDEELAYDGEPKAPFITTFGARIKFLPPVRNEKLRAWVFAGFGYGVVSAPGYHQALPGPTSAPNTPLEDVAISSTSGSFFEIPFGVGGSYRIREPWVLLAELSGRVGVDSSGSYFDPTGRPGQATSDGSSIGVITGTETFAVILTVGIGIDL